jgi:hypothetical protein
MQQTTPARSARLLLALTLAGSIAALGCAQTASSTTGAAGLPGSSPSASVPAASGAVLTAEERRDGWELLFDGATTRGWRGFKKATFPEAGWVVEDGTLVHKKDVKAGDIVTEAEYDNFDLRFEFKLTEGANSGVKYLMDEDVGVSFEFQVLDDAKHPDAKMGKGNNRTCGGLYDLIAPAPNKVVRPIGEWNEGRVLVNGAHVEHWLNGQKVVEYERGSEALKARIAESKWKDNPRFGQATKGRILLQDHKDEVAFRNLRVRRLPPQATAAR